MGNEKLTDNDVSAIDKALAAAKQRKANREGNPAGLTATEKPAKAPKAEKTETPKRPRLTDEEKAAKKAAREQERAEKKASRDQERAAKKAQRESSKQPAHMRKVAKAAEKLPALDQAAELLFNEMTANYTAAQLAGLALHIQHFNRVKATERAISQNIENGQEVRIIDGDPRFIGKTGIVSKAQRIRCYVTVPGVKKDVYLFTSHVEPVAAANNENEEPVAKAS